MSLLTSAGSHQIAQPVTSCHRKWSRIVFGFAIKSGWIPPDAADDPTRIVTCGGYGPTTLLSNQFPKTVGRSLIDIDPVGWNLTERTGASWICRRRMVSDRRAWSLHRVVVILPGARGGRSARVPDSSETQSSYPPSQRRVGSVNGAVVVRTDGHHIVQRIIAAPAQPVYVMPLIEIPSV